MRQIEGARKADVHAKLAPREPKHFKSVSEIRAENHYEQPKPDPAEQDRARVEIQSQFAEERLALEARHSQERENLKREFKAENQQAIDSRGARMLGQSMNRRKDFGRPIKKQPVRAQNLRWWREDQQRLASQQIEYDRLIKRQQNDLARLAREEVRAVRQHDREMRDTDRPLHARTPEDRLIADARAALERLHMDDRAPNSPIAFHTRNIEMLEAQRQADDRRLVTFLNHQENSKQLFRAVFQDTDASYARFRERSRSHGLKDAQNELLRRPEQFGAVKTQPSISGIESVAQALRSVHYTEKKMFDVRLRVEDGLNVSQAMREHGIEGEKWRHGAAAIEDNLSRQIQAHETALSRLKAEPDDRRLALMAGAQQAASKLDADAFARMPERQRRELQEIGEKLRERTNQERLREIRAREAQHEQDLLRAQNRDRGDPRHHQ